MKVLTYHVHVTCMSHALPAALKTAGAHVGAAVGALSVGPCINVLTVEEEVRGKVGGGGDQCTQPTRSHVRQT